MSLDDIIKNNKKSTPSSAAGGGGGGGGGFRGRGRISGVGGAGPTRRLPNRAGPRTGPYAAKAPDSTWKHDMYSDQMAAPPPPGAFPAAAGRGSIETGTKLYISNLDYNVSNEDVKELFSEEGDLKRFTVHYDRSGRSKGTAEVVFSRRADAIAAVKRYNNVQLDGKPMKIEIVGTNIGAPPAVPQASNGTFGNPNGAPRSFPGRGGPNGLSRGAGRGRARGRGRGRGRSEPVSVADLDADLDKYHSESMQIN